MGDNELVDIVNEADEVLFQATRKDAHDNGWIHRTVIFTLFNPLGEIYFTQRSLTKDSYKGYWSNCMGGHVLAGETYQGTISKELGEETDITESRIILLDRFKKRFDPTDLENVQVYAVISQQRPNENSSEYQKEFQKGLYDRPELLFEMRRYNLFIPEAVSIHNIVAQKNHLIISHLKTNQP